MANVIRYNVGSTPDNAIKSGNFAIGVNFGGYGSTAGTNYWNGKTPNVGGYMVYQSNGTSSPTLYAAANDAELITYSIQLGGGVITTIGQALTYFNSSSTLTCVNVDYPNIVTTNLTLNLDAGFTPSYPRTGTTWNDISGSGYTSTLVNGVSYGGNALSFDGSDDAVTLPSTITLAGGNNWSVCMWVSAGVFSSSGYGTLLSNNSGGPVSNAFGVINGKISYDYYTTTWNQQLGNTTLTAGPWYFLTWVNSSPGKMLMYVNGVVDCALFNGNSGQSNPVNSIGRNWTTTFNGKISGVSIYQGKSLTDQEVLQNYYAGLQRFIPTDFILYLDGNNTNKQVMTASTANDISGNNNTGTLINGVTLVRDGQRSFSLDGSDDYISLNNTVLSTMSDDNSLTVSMFVNINEATLSTAGGLLCNQRYQSEGDSGGFGFVIRSGGLIAVNLTKVISSVATSYEYISSFSMDRQQFALYTFTYNSSTKTVITYKNGVQQATSTNASYGWTKNTTNRPTYIGINSQGGWGAFYKMIIGQVRVYDRVLSAANILTIYTATKSRYGL